MSSYNLARCVGSVVSRGGGWRWKKKATASHRRGALYLARW